MANRYWVGGTASWDGTAGTKWATTSGGAGGASVPTTADDVFFSVLSTGVCTIATGNTGAKSINCTGFTGTITGTSPITVAGSVTLFVSMTYSHTATVTLTGTGTLTSAGKTFGALAVNGSGITVTLGDALNVSSSLTITEGEFNTANFSVNVNTLLSNNSNVRTITLGSSTLVITGFNQTSLDFNNSTNLTFNANTSQISITGWNSTFSGGGQTFYNVSFAAATGPFLSTINGANTFNNLTVQAASSVIYQLSLSADQTVNGTFSGTSTTATSRVFFFSSTPGTARTITAAAASASDCDFRDIIIAGAAAPISPTRGGNCGGNSGITFPAAKTVYKLGSGNWNASASWALSSGGAGSDANFPLAQDTAIVDNNSASTVTIQTYNIGALNCSSRSVALTLNYASSALWYGSHTLSSSVTVSGTTTQAFFGRGTMVFTSAGRTITFQITVSGPGGTFQLADALNAGTAFITVVRGTFDTANFAVTAGSISSTFTSVRTITLGSSTVTLSGSINFTDPTNLTFNGGTSQINLSATNSAVFGGSQTFYNVSFTSTAVGTRQITGANTFNNLTLTASGTGLTQLQIGGDQTFNGTFTCTGSSAIARGSVRSDAVGTTRTLTCAAASITNCDFRDITIAGAVAPISVTGGGDCGGNSGITFPAAKTVYWNLAGTQNWNATGWATTSAGTPNVNNFPLAQDTATFTDSGAAGTVAFGLAYNAGTIDASARTSAMTLNHSATFSIHGSYILGSGVTVSGTTGQTFSGTGTQTFTSAGKTITFPITVDKPAGSAFELGDAFTSSTTITHTRGTLDGKIYNLTCTSFTSSNSNVRTISMGSGLWTLTTVSTIWNTGITTNLTFNKDTANILLSNTTTTARFFSGGGLSFNKLTIGGATGTSVTTLLSVSSFTELASIKTVAHTVRLAADLGTIDTWSITGTVGNVVTVDSSAAGTRRTFNLTNVTTGIDYLSVKDIGVNQASRFYVGVNSTDGGNNSNVIFTAAPPATQTLTPALFTNTNTFYLTTITQTGPPQSLLPDLYINPNTIYAATLTASNELAPARYDNTNVFYAPTVTQPSLQTLTPALYTNPNTIYAATVTGNNTLTPARYDNTNVFYSAVVSQAGALQTLTPALYNNTNVFYAATVTGNNTLTPARYNNTNVFYSASISRGAVTLTPARYNNTNVFYSASISRGAVTIAPDRYNNVNVIFAANVLAVNTLTPARYNNSNVFYSAVIVQTDPKIEPPLTVNANIFFGAYLISFPPANFKPPWSRQPMPPPEEQPREAFQVTQTPREPLVVTENPRQSFQESSTPRQSFQESSTPRQSFDFSA